MTAWFASAVLAHVLNAAPVTFTNCEQSLDAGLVAGLFVAQRPSGAPSLEVECRGNAEVIVRRPGVQRSVTLTDVSPALKAQTLALVLVEVARGRSAEPKPASSTPPLAKAPAPKPVAAPTLQPLATVTEPTSEEPPVSAEPSPPAPAETAAPASPPAPKPQPLTARAAPSDAPREETDQPVTISLTPAVTTTVEQVELAPGHEETLRVTGTLTLGFGVAAIASALAGSMLLGMSNDASNASRIAGWSMVGLGVSCLTGAAISVALWFSERNVPGAVVRPRPL